MVIIERKQTEPYFNIAAEEFVLRELQEDCFSLWRNEPAIIVGRHQNTIAEINAEYVEENNIPVIRRLSGGGAVFHDLGNICFTFVKNVTEGGLPDFEVFTQPIIDVLQELGVTARFVGRNDLEIDGRKFSGNANAIQDNRFLHHGTLLFQSNFTNLIQSLKSNPLKFEGKAVQSIQKRITNIQEHLSDPMSVEEFIKKIEEHVHSKFLGSEYRSFTEEEEKEIRYLVEHKYKTKAWNYGQSPAFKFKKGIHTAKGGNMEIHCGIESGRIKEVKIFGDYFFTQNTSDFENLLRGCVFERAEIRKCVQKININDYFANITEDELVNLFFIDGE